MNSKSDIIIFTDGASKGNPGPGGWGAVIIFRENNDGESKVQSPKSKVVEIGGKVGYTTNNRMELVATIQAFSFVSTLNPRPNDSQRSVGQAKPYNLVVYSDSRYLINGITKWIFGWQKNDWLTKTKDEVLNRDLWEQLLDNTKGRDIDWQYVGGHVGVAGNERCDEIATQFADNKKPKLYSGVLDNYGMEGILDILFDTSKKEKKDSKNARSRAAAYSYVSLVDGVINVDKTWIDCERRVKGKSGARFKKSFSPEEEVTIKKSLIDLAKEKR